MSVKEKVEQEKSDSNYASRLLSRVMKERKNPTDGLMPSDAARYLEHANERKVEEKPKLSVKSFFTGSKR